MQGRKPDPFILKKRDVPILQQLLRDGQTSQRIARRARILLNRTSDQRVNQVMRKVDRSASTVWRVCERYRLHGLDAALYDAPRSGRPRVYSPRVRKRIETLACTEPATVGWHLSHWSTRSLEQAAIEQEIVARIHYTTISDILRAAHLRPDRFRYWKTTVWDAEAIARTIKILWYYERIQALWQDSIVFRYVSPEQVLEHLLKSGAGTAFHDAIKPSRRPALTERFLQMMASRHGPGKKYEVRHEYVACVACQAA